MNSSIVFRTATLIVTLALANVARGEIAAHNELDDPKPTPEFAKKFLQLSQRPQKKGDPEEKAFLYVPRTATSDDKRPLIIWLHGSGLIEFDEEFGPLKWIPELLLRNLAEEQEYPFFVLVPKLRRDRGRWFLMDSAGKPDKSAGDDMLDVAMRFLDETVSSYPVDVERVSVVGISSGGSAAWELGMRESKRFAAIVPVAGASHGNEKILGIAKTPVWAFANDKDDAVIGSVRQAVDSLRAAGGIVHLTEFDDASHDAWTGAFSDEFELVSWLTNKRRSDPAWKSPPGTPPSLWRQELAMSLAPYVLIGTTVLFLGYQEFKKTKLAPSVGTDDPVQNPPSYKWKVADRRVVYSAVAIVLFGVLLKFVITWISTPHVSAFH